MLLNVALIGQAHALRGAVRLDVRTDDPAARLRPGSVFLTEPADRGPLTLVSLRRAGTGWVAQFEDVDDRDAAEALRGTALVVETNDVPAETDAWYPHELVGLDVVDVEGVRLGEVVAVEHPPAHDVIVVRLVHGSEVTVPFVTAIVPVVDVPGGRVVLDPPTGLLDDSGEG